MDNKSHKQQIVDHAIAGLVEGGFPSNTAESFRILLTRIYECGYNEAIRERSTNQTWQD